MHCYIVDIKLAYQSIYRSLIILLLCIDSLEAAPTFAI